MQKIIKILILFLIFFLPIFHSRLFDSFGIPSKFLLLNSNFELAKVLFFNIFSSIIIILFFTEKIFSKNIKQIKIPKNKFFYLFYVFLIINTIFSSSFFVSFFGSTAKGHSFLMINNLFLLFIIFLNLTKSFYKKIIFTIIISSFFVSIIAIKEYFFPSYSYGDLSNRAIGTFGHPNFLSLYLLFSIIFLYKKIFTEKKFFYLFFLIFIIFALILTKSALAIFLFIIYNFYFFYKKYFNKKIIFSLAFFSFFLSFIIFSFYFLYLIYPEKLSSFISRFFVWETSLKIIFSDFKTFFIGNGLETLPYYFPNFKNIYLYIFENIGFSADRPHNIFLYFFYHFGIIGLSFFIYFLINLYKISKKNIYFEIFFVFLIFNFFNFSSIASYLIIIFILSQIFKENKFLKNLDFFSKKFFIIFLAIIFSVINIFYSYKFYKSENYNLYNNYSKALENFPYNPKNYYKIGDYENGLKIEKIKSKNYFLAKIIKNGNLEKNCLELVKNFSSAENYFLCGEYLEKFGQKKEAIKFYKNGLKKLPDLWNKNSLYYQNKFLKKFIQKDRFLSKKYSNLKEILEKVK